MNTSRQVAVIGFSGQEDTDSAFQEVRNGDFIDSLNTRGRHGSAEKVRVPVRSNTLIPATLPAGDNECIGTVEDEGSLIYFLKNTSNNHSIRRYYPDDTFEEILQDSILNFSNRIKARLVDDLLYWTDAEDISGPINGNPPRKINTAKAVQEGKSKQYELYFGSNAFDAGTEYSIQTLNADLTTDIALQVLYTVPAGPPAKSVVIAALVTAIQGFSLNATAFNNHILVEHPTAGKHIRIVGSGGSPASVHLVPVNHYPSDAAGGLDLLEDQITIVKPTPRCAPKPRYEVDAAVRDRKVYGFSFQFRYRYIFDDGEKSKWGPASYVPTNFFVNPEGLITNTELYNKIVLEFNDARLSSASWKCFIRAIDIAVRYSANDIWRLVDRVHVRDIGVDVLEADFVNAGSYPAVPSDEAGDATQQSLGNFDFVPLLSNAIETIADKDGNYILTLSGNLQDQDLVEVVSELAVGSISSGSTYPSSQDSRLKGLKSGGSYKVGVVYQDAAERQSVVVPLGQVRVPFSQLTTNIYHLSVDFASTPPLWARSFKIAISKNQNQSRYFQLPIWRVLFWKYDRDEDQMIATTKAAGDATHIGFEMSLNDIQDESIRNFIFNQSESNNVVFVPEPLDRIQIVDWNSANPSLVAGDIETYNYLIVGYSPTYPNTGSFLDRLTVFIEYDSSIPDLDPGATATTYLIGEIYRPNRVVEDNIYYEFVECYDISDPGTGSASHGSKKDFLNYGDAYSTNRRFTHGLKGGTGPHEVIVDHIQRPSLYTVNTEIANDLGRVVIEDPDYKQRYLYEDIRASDIYLSGNLNGLSSFRGSNYIKINRAFGSIQATELVDNVLLAICRYKSQPIYVSKGNVLDLSGNELIGTSSKLFNVANELQDWLGTHNPESVINERGRVYAIDVRQGKVWRYSTGGGQFPVSEYGKSRYYNFYSKSWYPDVPKIVGGFQREFMTYYLVQPDATRGFQDSYTESDRPGWTGRYSFAPEFFGQVGNIFVSFKDGELWKHETGNYCNFYGVQEDATIKVVVNDRPQSDKIFWNLILQSSTKWWFPAIEIPANESYPSGMLSRLKANKVFRYEGRFHANFLRDLNDPSKKFTLIANPTDREIAKLLQGRMLRGDVLICELQLNSPSLYSELYALQIFYTLSEPSI